MGRCNELAYYKFYAISIHGDLDQRERDQALIRFSNGSVSVLVATDVAGRGLDIDDLDMVINFNIAHDPEIHTHRIGRTGRAGKHGMCYKIPRQIQAGVLPIIIARRSCVHRLYWLNGNIA
jgi:ATP-independent RNA helicase DbpA